MAVYRRLANGRHEAEDVVYLKTVLKVGSDREEVVRGYRSYRGVFGEEGGFYVVLAYI